MTLFQTPKFWKFWEKGTEEFVILMKIPTVKNKKSKNKKLLRSVPQSKMSVQSSSTFTLKKSSSKQLYSLSEYFQLKIF